MPVCFAVYNQAKTLMRQGFMALTVDDVFILLVDYCPKAYEGTCQTTFKLTYPTNDDARKHIEELAKLHSSSRIFSV